MSFTEIFTIDESQHGIPGFSCSNNAGKTGPRTQSGEFIKNSNDSHHNPRNRRGVILTKTAPSDYRESVEQIIQQSRRHRTGRIPKTAMAGSKSFSIPLKEHGLEDTPKMQNAMSFEDAIGTSSLPHTVPDAVMRKFKDGTDNISWGILMQTMRPSRKKRSLSWSVSEKKRFIDCLQQFGLDFAAITSMFPNRSRMEIRKAFKVIHASNPHFINQLLRQHKVTFSSQEIQTCIEKSNMKNI